MIYERRQAHFWSSVALIGLLPLGFLVALLCRPTYAPAGAEANGLFDAAGFASADQQRNAKVIKTMVWQNAVVPIEGEILQLVSEGKSILAVTPTVPLRQPDVLLYWLAGKSAAPDTLPANALLLGSLAGQSRREFTIPAAMQGKAGNLLIYSQAKDTVLSVLPLAADMTTLSHRES
ncbi:hypothetical protein IQ266_11075 [filamentous cyanobacterium LEGE 11480]|uniref:Uncharacterized protein n=1 Tax=Romeriopsis navalis LEGE 11480 TaxID=2777977 RepID=A0A928Z4F5_9CYAN|nr:hypothetical protein [Romeriopsis navalis]MBE9030273.1 hypothetical protein [Romeriopsis navalis LEGE 11480]